MAEVKWIKLSIDTFNDEKVQLLESLPEGPSVLLIWMKLLCLAGKVNDGGYVYVGQNLPYTDEMLATIFRQPVNNIRLALSTFEKFEMVEINEHGIYISNWVKHQNVEGMERQKELNRERVSRFRAKQLTASIEPSNITCNVTDHYSNAPRKKKEERREKNSTTPTPSKINYAERVTMLESEYSTLVQELGKEGANRCVEILDTYKGANGKQYKSDYLAIKNWVIQRYIEDKAKSAKVGAPAMPSLAPTVKRYKAIRRVKDGQGRTMMQSSPGFFMTEQQAREWAGPDGDVNEADIPIDYTTKQPQGDVIGSIRNLAAGMKVN